ncbi:glycosyltransferase [Schaalia odontolytica]|uniref:Glycosyltransferase n=2 Tax=Schaalia odontolytica TaxID=1660 RepID=A0A857A5J6_9ACTO|nr:glycosyltransferase [Schaalia odontolytica]EFF80723.1 glycosyltransferase, group 1 family protein [Schaalia odontolytica F0309]QGS10650.1 glycosyltransferase [Schaalia odontolytica]
MLVTLATRTFTPEPTAAALRLGALARALAAGGDRVRVLTSRLALSVASDACRLADGGVDVGEDSGLVEVRRAPVLRDRTGAVRGYVSYMSFDLPLIARLLAGPRPDVVVSEPPPTTGAAVRIACAARRVPYVYYCADIVSDAAALAGVPGFVVRTVAGLESFALRGARRVIAVSDGVARCARDMGARDVAVVPNGVRVPEAVATGTPEGFPTCGGPVFVYAGTVAQWLAPEVFVDAFERARARLGDARLVFVGQGSGWDALAERSRGVAGVEMIPAVSAEEADRWMARATATLASLRPGGYDYAYPTKILASLAQGTPVIYAGPGQAARDIAEGELGVACNLNADEVAEAMVGLASGTAAWVGAEGARAWVSMHRSVEASSRAAAAVVRSALA